MIKAVLCSLIVAICSYTGFIYGERYKKRFNNLKELQRSLLQLENEILFAYTSLPTAVSNIAMKSKGCIKPLFLEISLSLSENKFDSVYEAFTFSFEKYKEQLNFTDEDLSIIMDLSKSLGEVDILGHEKIFALASNNLKKSIDDSEDSVRKNLKMYRYLGICSGLGIVILLL
ncbi:stage III sporulation protein SpoIIIAB [Clostridium polynesiense]|uniref:stage III sporulation protein SpoIIIAB n=1 Tax=Clostridium polynesiense TaxID=1325933 RepID=UPI00059005AF|nr:stage III sporulation protein SpoIIIAB [Clostridium polynesiense]